MKLYSEEFSPVDQNVSYQSKLTGYIGLGRTQWRQSALPAPTLSVVHSQIWHSEGSALSATTRTSTSMNRFWMNGLLLMNCSVLNTDPSVSSLSATHRSLGIMIWERISESPTSSVVPASLRVYTVSRSTPDGIMKNIWSDLGCNILQIISV